MKELRVLIGIYLLLILLVIACTKIAPGPMPVVIDLGKESAAVKFVSAPVVNNGTVTFSLQTTIGAKYSVQVVDIRGDVKVKQGILADSDLEVITLPLDKVDIGAYDLIILDVKGAEIKQPIIKKI